MLSKEAKRLPRNLQIEPTNCCDLKCYMCPGRAMKRKKGLMSMHTFRLLIDSLKNQYTVEERKQTRLALCGQGEPLVNRHIFDMIQLAKENDFVVEITTNATLLTEENIERLVKIAKVDIICISWYAFDENTFKNIYGKSGYEHFLNNVLNLIHYISRNDMKTVISCTWLSSQYNIADQNFAGWFFNRLPIARTRGHRVRNYRMLFETIGIQEKDVVMERLNEYKKENPSDYLIGSLCLWNMLYVHWDGGIYPCICDYNGEYLLGNVLEETICSVWNSDKMQEFRECVLEGKEIPGGGKYCEYCTAATPKSMLMNETPYRYRTFEEYNDEVLKGKYDKFEQYFPYNESQNWKETLDKLRLKWTGIKEEEERSLDEILEKYLTAAKDQKTIYIIGEYAESLQCKEYILEKRKMIQKDIELIGKHEIEQYSFSNNEALLICDYEHNQFICEILKGKNYINIYEANRFNYFYAHNHDDFNITGQYKYQYSL